MEPEGWRKLESEALWTLEHADQAPPREGLYGMALQLRLWQVSEAGLHLSWSLIVPVREYRERRAVVRELCWDRGADWAAATNPLMKLKRRASSVPSLRLRDAELGWEQLSPYLAEAGGLPMGRGEGASAGEGTSGLEGHRSLAHVRMSWSGKGPRGWADTVAWFTRFRKLLARVIRERERGAGVV